MHVIGLAVDITRSIRRRIAIRLRVLAAGVILISLAACSQERPSKIVKMVENAGAGELRRASRQSIRLWLDKHPDVAVEADKLCKPVRASARAKWPETTEGRVCNAAREVAGYLEWRRQLKTDGKTYEGGWK